jgi:hypothetical protein
LVSFAYFFAVTKKGFMFALQLLITIMKSTLKKWFYQYPNSEVLEIKIFRGSVWATYPCGKKFGYKMSIFTQKVIEENGGRVFSVYQTN